MGHPVHLRDTILSALMNLNEPIISAIVKCQKKKSQMYVYTDHALSYTKLVHRHANQTEGNKHFK